MKKPIFLADRPKPSAPLSPAMLAEGKFLFVSGQGANDPKTGVLVKGSFEEQSAITFENVQAILEAGGASWSDVVSIRVYLDDRKYFDEMNQIFKRYLKEPYPSRTTIAVGLPREGMLIEIDCIALIPA